MSNLSKEQQDFFYHFVESFHHISTDLRNVDILLHNGKFFDAMDKVRECQQMALISEEKVKECVKLLNKENKW